MEDILKIVIVEDEHISAAYLKKLIGESGVPHQIVGELTSLSECLIFFGKLPQYDLIFMDIHLSDGTSFDLLDSMTIEKPIVFLTTFDSYAIDAFRYNSIDYILKPAKMDDIHNALKKYWSSKRAQETEYLNRIGSMLSNFSPPSHKKRFLVREDNTLKLVDIAQISCFYSEDGQTYLVDHSGKQHTVEFPLERLEELLDPEQFFRINRKLTIAINEIHSVEDYFNNRLKVLSKNNIPMEMIVSRNRVKSFKDWLKGV